MAIGGGFLYVDAKRDQKDVDELYQFAVLTGRVQDMIVVDPGNPSQSHTYNPIADGDEDEIADRILTWIPASTTSPERITIGKVPGKALPHWLVR